MADFEYEDLFRSKRAPGGGKNDGIKKAVGQIKRAFHGRTGKPGYGKSGAKEAVMKVSGYAATSASVKRMMLYVARMENEEEKKEQEQVEIEKGTDTQKREKPLVLVNEQGMVIDDRARIEKLHSEWAKDFDRKERGKKPNRHAAHLMFSAGVENTVENQRRVAEAAFAMAEKEFNRKGFSFVLGVHQDGKYPHVHLIVKTKSRESSISKGRKLRIGREDVFHLRTEFAKELSRRGLEHQATLRRDRPQLVKQIREGKAALKSRSKGPNKLESEGPLDQRLSRGLGKLQASEKRMQRAMARKRNPKYNAMEFREFSAEQFDKMRDIVRAETHADTPERYAAMNQIRSVERDFKKRSDPKKEFAATMNHWESKVEAYGKLKEKYEQERPGWKPKEAVNKELYLASEGGEIQRGMDKTKTQTLLLDGVPETMKNQGITLLKEQTKVLNQARGKDKGIGLSRLFGG